MCISIPKKVVEIRKDIAIVELAGNKSQVKSLIKVKKGDYVLVQNKMIVEIVPKEQLESMIKK